MKKWAIVLLIVISICFTGCSNNGDVSSLSEYEMVFADEKNAGISFKMKSP